MELLFHIALLIIVSGIVMWYIILSRTLKQSNPNTALENENVKLTIANNQLIAELAQRELLSNDNYRKYEEASDELLFTNSRLGEEKEANKKILSQKKSSEVRLGKSFENLAPIIDSFPYAQTYRHVGGIIDGIAFDLDNDKIVLIEIKTGGARLSARQKKVKEIVEKGNVSFEEIRLNKTADVILTWCKSINFIISKFFPIGFDRFPATPIIKTIILH